MKSSTRKIIGIGAGALALTAITGLLPLGGVLRSYLQVAVLAGAVAASLILLGWAKPYNRNTKLVATFVILAAVVFQIVIFLLLGPKLGFAQNVYLWNWTSLFVVFLPVILATAGEEILRGQLVARGQRSMPAIITTGIVICLIQIIIVLPIYNLHEAKDVFTLIVAVIGPTVLNNILLTYIAYAYDYRIGIAYRLIMELPTYLLPILPNAGLYLPVIFQIGLIFVLALWLIGIHQAKRKNEAFATSSKSKHKKLTTETERKVKRTLKWTTTGVAVVIVVGFVALMSGLFKYHFLAVGSGSMAPNLLRGDMVLVEKSDDYEKMREGDVLVYRYSNVIMVHRIIAVTEEDGKYTFQTKGDANDSADRWVVNKSDVIGIAKGRIAMFGYPTLWLNELFNKE